MSVWKSIKAWAVETMNEGDNCGCLIENIRTIEQAKQEELRKAKLEAEQPKKTDMERILDAMKASMHEEGRWKAYEDKFEVEYKERATKKTKWVERTSHRLIDTKTGWGIVCSFNYEDVIRDKTGSVYVQEENARHHTTEEVSGSFWSYTNFGGCVTTLEKRSFVPTRRQLDDLLTYYEDNIARPKREAERKAKEQQEIDVLKQMYL